MFCIINKTSCYIVFSFRHFQSFRLKSLARWINRKLQCFWRNLIYMYAYSTSAKQNTQKGKSSQHNIKIKCYLNRCIGWCEVVVACFRDLRWEQKNMKTNNNNSHRKQRRRFVFPNFLRDFRFAFTFVFVLISVQHTQRFDDYSASYAFCFFSFLQRTTRFQNTRQ